MQLFPTPKNRPTTQHYHTYTATLPRQDGRTIAITGCTSGTGQVLARTCGDLGARVVMLNRPSSRAEAALSDLQERGAEAVFVPCDLQNLGHVRQAAELLHTVCPEGIDVLCNNAGVMGLPDRATDDGFDVQMQTNHLSHVLLTHGIWPLLERAATERGEARLVNHSSGARHGITLEARYMGRNGGNLGGDRFPGMGRWRRYQQTKLANLLFTYALADQIATHRPSFADTIKCVCAHPGPTDSGLQAKTTQAGGTQLLDQFVIWRTLRRAHSVEDGTHGILRATCDPNVHTRDFFGPARRGYGGPAELLPQERNPQAEAMLWRESLQSLQLTSFFPQRTDTDH